MAGKLRNVGLKFIKRGMTMIKRFTTDEVTETCSNCMRENTLQWNVAEDGYKAYCPHCGNRLMLCGVCPIRNDCEYNAETDGCPMEHECCLDRDRFIEYLKNNFDINSDMLTLISNLIDVLSSEFRYQDDRQESFKRVTDDIIPLTNKEINMIKF